MTARIRDALRKIERRHPALGAHLRQSVVTGRMCSYRLPASGTGAVDAARARQSHFLCRKVRYRTNAITSMSDTDAITPAFVPKPG